MKLFMASILSFLLLAWPALAAKLSQDEPSVPKRLYYYRDGAGLSNVRLQFEALVAIAAASSRILMIPPPSMIDHLPQPFQETNVWSENDLSKVVLFEYAKNDQAGGNWCPPGAFHLPKALEEIQPHELPENQDWCFGQAESRLRNFECLRMFSPGQQKIATVAVFNGLQIKQQWKRKAREVLGRLGLKPGNYVAAHLRRGDFIGIGGIDFGSLDKAIPTLNHYGQGKDVLILTDETDPASIKRLHSSVNAATSLSFSSVALGKARLKLEGAVVDMLLGAMAGTFIGTPSSTFSLSIQQIRSKMDLCKKAPQKRHALAFLSTHEQVRITRWFDSSHVFTYTGDADRTACGYDIGDFSKITEYKDFDFANEAACQLEDVQ